MSFEVRSSVALKAPLPHPLAADGGKRMGKWEGRGFASFSTDKTWLIPGELAWSRCSEKMCRIKRAEAFSCPESLSRAVDSPQIYINEVVPTLPRALLQCSLLLKNPLRLEYQFSKLHLDHPIFRLPTTGNLDFDTLQSFLQSC